MATRTWIQLGVFGVVAAVAVIGIRGGWIAGGPAHSEEPRMSVESASATVMVHVFNQEGELVGPVESARVAKPAAQWERELTDAQYRILREAGTERPGSSDLLGNKQEGVYACAGCGLPLYASGAKFDSGTGWPSFYEPIAPGNVAERQDTSHGMVRTEALCARCGGHLGHVFPDGPRPTGMRHCINGDALAFTPQQQVSSLADPAAQRAAAGGSLETVVLAGGCFWCTEAVFEPVRGVVSVVSGYAGGEQQTARYDLVSSGRTRHAEAIRITYDPAEVSYEQLLELFFTVAHDPTQLNRQGADVGPQYRSAVFYSGAAQKAATQAYLDKLRATGKYDQPIVTALEPLEAFYPAEDYHQDYAARNPAQPYVQAVAVPKVRKLHASYGELLKDGAGR